MTPAASQISRTDVASYPLSENNSSAFWRIRSLLRQRFVVTVDSIRTGRYTGSVLSARAPCVTLPHSRGSGVPPGRPCRGPQVREGGANQAHPRTGGSSFGSPRPGRAAARPLHRFREHRDRRPRRPLPQVRHQPRARAPARQGQGAQQEGLRRLEPLLRLQALLPRGRDRADRGAAEVRRGQELRGHPARRGRDGHVLPEGAHQLLRGRARGTPTSRRSSRSSRRTTST